MATHPLLVILRPLGLGDFLTGVPAYRAIRRAFPLHRIVLAAPRALSPLVDLTGAIDSLHDTQPLVALDRDLCHADVAIDLHGCGPASHRILLDAHPRRLIAFANDEIPQSLTGARWRAEEHEVERWCRMLGHAGIPADKGALDLTVPANVVLHGVAGATLLHPSAASESRRWPPDRWSALARAERAAGRNVILTGDSNDVERVEQIATAAQLPSAHVYAGRTNLRELAALVAAAGRVVCGDTGVAHLATAYRRPSIVLFGPVSPAHWGPPPERVFHRALWTGKLGDPHGDRVDPGLLELTVETVKGALDALVRSDIAA